ncbi:hypothetical protein PT250_06505 [Erysipelothrix rhusiopathiae]|uniref:Rod shape-determining protein MreD n=1 Tax=Erysipelothrix rhusiopathiae ATCC 19414 TaxID=525280 RepID=E7FUX2_ERYRH|nr:hypothetical protein [Erysipelothrix rhusiopathiae]UPU39807.1 hypothetical protein MX850_03555 [Erysipelothrix sp. Poltava]EFY09762.1 putative rod shape-determining protein MreD [Erysipelothrix rhusiopathiae ATCC 19414]MCG4436122.1 hypothetical protein [Erysipelothrix rhusiopathiae]MDE8032518.1 hypothetical protein [Erysipelothrix rhusiopathiae]MDE8036059.1 hypothetical protein [Erysipelothrix rhusiopathiae]
MRMIRWMHFLYIVVLLVLDSIFNAIFTQLGLSSLTFVSSLHFLGLMLLTQNDSQTESIIKAILLGIWMDLCHIGSFPMFFVSYSITIALLRVWDRYIGTSTFEFLVLAVIGLFIKEMLIFGMLPLVKGVSYSLITFISTRTLWVIIGNLILLPIAMTLYKLMHRMIMQRVQNLYMR